MSDLEAAVVAGLVGANGDRRQALVQSIVEVARAIFRAQAASILLHDADTDELVFAAVAGEGEEALIGKRFPSSAGIAGWVLVTRQSVVLEDVAADPRFARSIAAASGYIPKGLMAAPLLAGDAPIGVLQVLDRPKQAAFSLGELDLLGQFANQAAIAVELILHARRVERVLGDAPDELRLVARAAAAIERTEGADRALRLRLLEALTDVLEHASTGRREA
jgi:GAF domain-containing protein